MFGDYGPVAQRHMATVWSRVFACALADAVWLPNSRLFFAIVMRRTLILTELLWRAALPLGLLLAAGATLSYLIASAALPLGDALLGLLIARSASTGPAL